METISVTYSGLCSAVCRYGRSLFLFLELCCRIVSMAACFAAGRIHMVELENDPISYSAHICPAAESHSR